MFWIKCMCNDTIPRPFEGGRISMWTDCKFKPNVWLSNMNLSENQISVVAPFLQRSLKCFSDHWFWNTIIAIVVYAPCKNLWIKIEKSAVASCLDFYFASCQFMVELWWAKKDGSKEALYIDRPWMIIMMMICWWLWCYWRWCWWW